MNSTNTEIRRDTRSHSHYLALLCHHDLPNAKNAFIRLVTTAPRFLLLALLSCSTETDMECCATMVLPL